MLSNTEKSEDLPALKEKSTSRQTEPERTSGHIEAGLWVQAAIKPTWSPKHDYSD